MSATTRSSTSGTASPSASPRRCSGDEGRRARARRVQPDQPDGRLRRPRLARAGAPARRHARPHVQALGRGHGDADHRQLPRRPLGVAVLHLDPRRAQGPGRHRAQDRGLRLPHAPSGRRGAGRHHHRDRLRHHRRHLRHRHHGGRRHPRAAARPRGRPRQPGGRSSIRCRPRSICSVGQEITETVAEPSPGARASSGSRSGRCSPATRAAASARSATAATWPPAARSRSARRWASSPRSRSASRAPSSRCGRSTTAAPRAGSASSRSTWPPTPASCASSTCRRSRAQAGDLVVDQPQRQAGAGRRGWSREGALRARLRLAAPRPRWRARSSPRPRSWSGTRSPRSILSEIGGTVEFHDIVEGENVREETDKVTGPSSASSSRRRKREALAGDRGQGWPERPRSAICCPRARTWWCKEGQRSTPATRWSKIPRETTKTKDITGGLPRVQELFEARSPRDPAIITEIDGTVHLGEIVKGMRKVIVENEAAETREYLDPADHPRQRAGRGAGAGRRPSHRRADQPARRAPGARREGAPALPGRQDPGGLPLPERADQRQAHRGHRPPDDALGEDRGGRRH